MGRFIQKYRSLAFIALSVVLLAVAVSMLQPFYPALIWASVLTVLMWPIHKRICKRWPIEKCSPNIPASLTTLLTLAIIGLPIAVVGLALFFQVNSFVQEMRNSAPTGTNGFSLDYVIQQLDASLKPLLAGFAPDFSLTNWFNEHKDELFRNITAPAGKVVVSIGYAAFTLVIAFLTMFFMLRDGERLREPALELIPLPREKAELVLSRLSDTIRAVFVGIVLVAIVQGSIAGITYYFVGVPHALLWGVATIVLCTIPLLGAPILYIPMALILMSQGKFVGGFVLLGVGFLIVSQIDNILRPFIIGARVELHPMAVFFSLLGGIFLMGPSGIMAGPMLLIVLLTITDVIREKMKLREVSEK
jgi:predicted PurR-regulated permease PerM